ncbi:MAG: Ig-like domain-containing protein [bacterium]|nr:Ig-like domain-containing protein [bacterium]
MTPPRPARLVGLVAMLVVGALILSQCGGDDETTEDELGTDTTVEVSEATTTTTFAAPPAPDPLPPSAPAPGPAASAPAPAPASAPAPAPATSGPPPVAIGVMADLAIAVDGYAHAVFVQEYFSGPVTRFSASSSDTGVATAGVRTPDTLIVTPVSNGTARVTVTATGPGGAVTQTFVARVGAGPAPVTRPAAPPPAPAPAAPAPAPAPPPPDDSDELTPIDDELPPLPPDTGTDDAVPTGNPPTRTGSVPTQTVAVGATLELDVARYFGGVIRGWELESTDPAVADVTMTVAGRADVRGVAAGTATITVTASNNDGNAKQAFNVTVGAATTTTTTTTTAPAGSTATGFLVQVGDAPSVTLNVGQSTTLDISRYFSAAATSFGVEERPSGLSITVSGSSATITGVTSGDYTVQIVGSNANASVKRPLSIRVN